MLCLMYTMYMMYMFIDGGMKVESGRANITLEVWEQHQQKRMA